MKRKLVFATNNAHKLEEVAYGYSRNSRDAGGKRPVEIVVYL